MEQTARSKAGAAVTAFAVTGVAVALFATAIALFHRGGAGFLGPAHVRAASLGVLVVLMGVCLRARRRRPPDGAPRRAIPLLAAWIILWLAFFALFVETVVCVRFPLPRDIGKRPFHPYLVNGDVHGGVFDESMARREGPQVYGYKKTGGLHIYQFEEPVSGMADRGEFLFQNRVELANDTRNRDVLRIFVVGGSAARGLGASSEENRWYMVLERQLTESLGRQVRLVPAAMGAYVSSQERLVLDWMVLPRNPDAVIIFDGYNDAALPGLGSRPGDPYNQVILYDTFYSGSLGLKRWAREHSFLVRFAAHRSLVHELEELRRAILSDQRRLSNYTRSVASVYLDNLTRMKESCDCRGVPVFVFLQPARPLTLERNGALPRPAPGTPGRAYLSTMDQLTLLGYHAILEELPLRPTFDASAVKAVIDAPIPEAWFLDPSHFGDPGQRAVADAMLPILRDTLAAATPAGAR